MGAGGRGDWRDGEQLLSNPPLVFALLAVFLPPTLLVYTRFFPLD